MAREHLWATCGMSTLPCETLCNTQPCQPCTGVPEARLGILVSPQQPVTTGQPQLPYPRSRGRGLGGQDPSPAACHKGFGQVPSAPLSGRVWLLGAPSHACAPWFQGYEGLVEGGDNIKPANWLSVSNIIQLVRPVAGSPCMGAHVCARTGGTQRYGHTHRCRHTHKTHTEKHTAFHRGSPPG